MSERKIKIVLFSGKQGSGKTTALYNLKNWAIKNNWLFKGMKFAEPLYEMHDRVLEVANKYGITTPSKDGALLQILGTDWGRKQYGENVWAQITRNRVDHQIRLWHSHESQTDVPPYHKYNGLIVIDDCRFINEAEAFEDAYIVRLDCDRETRKARCPAWRDNENHPSETQFDAEDSYKYFDWAFDTAQVSPDEIIDAVAKRYLEV